MDLGFWRQTTVAFWQLENEPHVCSEYLYNSRDNQVSFIPILLAIFTVLVVESVQYRFLYIQSKASPSTFFRFGISKYSCQKIHKTSSTTFIFSFASKFKTNEWNDNAIDFTVCTQPHIIVYNPLRQAAHFGIVISTLCQSRLSTLLE